MTPRRGEIWLVEFGEPVGREQAATRPAVVVSADALNQGRSGLVIVVPTTKRPRPLPSYVELGNGDTGLDEVSYAKCEDVKSVSEQRLIARLGAADDVAMFRIGLALRYLLDL